MRLKGYIRPFKENSFTFPVYGDADTYYFHSVNDSFEIIDFYPAHFSSENFQQVYLSHDFQLGSFGAIVFSGTNSYISFGQADKNIDEINNYLHDTTVDTEFSHIKKEVSEIKSILQNYSDNGISRIDILENLEPHNYNDPSTFSFELPIFRNEIDYLAIDNFTVIPFEMAEIKENAMEKQLKEFIGSKNLFSTNREIFFHLLRKYMEENHNVIGEIMNNSELVKGFSSYLTHNSEEANALFDTTIETTLRLKAEERRKWLKEFNYQFHNNIDRTKEMTETPAYIRNGVVLTDISHSSKSGDVVRINLIEYDASKEQTLHDVTQQKNEGLKSI